MGPGLGEGEAGMSGRYPGTVRPWGQREERDNHILALGWGAGEDMSGQTVPPCPGMDPHGDTGLQPGFLSCFSTLLHEFHLPGSEPISLTFPGLAG